MPENDVLLRAGEALFKVFPKCGFACQRKEGAGSGSRVLGPPRYLGSHGPSILRTDLRPAAPCLRCSVANVPGLVFKDAWRDPLRQVGQVVC